MVLLIQCPPKVLGQFVKWTKSQYPRNSNHPMQYNQFSAKMMLGIKQYGSTIRPDLDPYCLQRSLKINILLVNIRKYFHLIQELLEGTEHKWPATRHTSLI